MEKPSTQMQIPLVSQMRSKSLRRIHSVQIPSTEMQKPLGSLMRSKSQKRSQSRCSIGMAFLVVINLLLEIVSAVTEQLSSIRKPYLARISLLVSILSVVLFIVELTRKIEHYKVHFQCNWPIPWFYYQSGGYKTIFGSLTEMILLFCVVGQLIVSTINCSFIERGSDSLIKISLWPLFFAIGMAISKLKDFNFDLTMDVQPEENL